MAAPPTSSPAPARRRHPYAWRARRVVAILSVVAALALGGAMAWHDGRSASASAAGSGVNTGEAASTPAWTPARADVSTRDDDHESDDESDDDSDDDDRRTLVPDLSGTSADSSSHGTSAPTASPHTSTRGS